MQGRARPDGLTGGRALATSDSSHEMAANGPRDLLIELFVAAARTSGGEVGLLRTAQVADVLGPPSHVSRRPAGRARPLMTTRGSDHKSA